MRLRIRRALAVLGLCLVPVLHAFGHAGLDEQVKELDARIAADPRNAGLYLRRGELHRSRADLLAGLRDFESARSIEPTSPEADCHAGRALLAAGLTDESLTALDRALKIGPDHLEARVTRGRALAKLGRHLEAAADFTIAIDSHPSSRLPQPHLYLERATALSSAGPRHLVEALKGLDEASGRLGPAVSLELAAIDLEVRLSRHDAALIRLERLAATSRTQGQWLARRGEIQLAAGRPIQARSSFEAALASLAAMPAARRSTGPVAAFETRVRGLLALLNEASGVREAGR